MDLRPLMTIEVAVRPVLLLGNFPLGERRLIPFSGGTFAGRDGLKGTVADGGVDWQTVRPDGTIEISAHYLLTTDEGESIEVHSDGLRAASPAVLARLLAGEHVDPGEYYFRTHIRLTTSSPRLDWMNRMLAVAAGARRRSHVEIDVHEVL